MIVDFLLFFWQQALTPESQILKNQTMIFAIALKQNQIWIERETYFSSSEVLEEDGGGHVNWSSTTTESTSDSPDGELETVFDRFFETGLVFGLCTETGYRESFSGGGWRFVVF